MEQSMKKIRSLILVIVLLNLFLIDCRAGFADFPDEIGKDKYIHFAAGVIISHAAYPVFRKYLKDKDKAWIYSFSMAVLASVGKELYDIDKTGFDIGDLAAGTLGGITIVTVRF